MALAPVCVWIGGTNRWMRGQSGGAVTKAYQSTSPATIYTKMRSNRAKSMCLPTVRIQRTDAYLDPADLEVSSLDVIDERKLAFLATDALSALGVPADLHSQVGVIVLPMPIVALVVRGEWAELFCWARFKFPWQTHCPGDCWINERANRFEQRASVEITPGSLLQLANKLRTWAPRICEDDDEDAAYDSQLDV